MDEKINELQKKIQATIAILDIPGKKEEMARLAEAMSVSDFWSKPEDAAVIGRRFEELKNEVEGWELLSKRATDLGSFSEDLAQSPDAEMQADLDKQLQELEKEFSRREIMVLFSHKNDTKNAIVSFHAGSGGTEAQDWAQMLLRMIMRYAEHKDWKVTVLDETKGQEAGIKSAMLRIEGKYAYGHLKSEHGTHRLVRISPFDAEALRQTSFALIEVLPEVEAEDDVQIDSKELRIDTFMSGGKGGQSVNTTYSAVRIVHLPTGTTVQCQNERSQLQNRETALRVLQSKLQKLQDEKEEQDRLKLRGEYKSPEWGNQIRSYVLHPYKMVKDIRTRYEVTNPEGVLNGELDGFVEAYLRWIKNGMPDMRGYEDNDE